MIKFIKKESLLLDYISKTKKYDWFYVMIVIVFFIINITNQFFRFEWMQINFISLLIIILVSLNFYRKFYNDIDKLIDLLPDTKTNLRIVIKNKYKPISKSRYTLIPGFVIGMVYAMTILLIFDYYKNITFYLGAFLMIFAAIISLCAYIQYVLCQKIAYDLSIEKFGVKEINNYSPQNTPWFVKLRDINTKLKNAFLLLGIMYTLQYGALFRNFNLATLQLLPSFEKVLFIISW